MPKQYELSEKDIARFWSKVKKTDTCWLWTDKPDKGGYGRFSWRADGRHVLVHAHRIAYLLLVGPIPLNDYLHHTCPNRNCVNALGHLKPMSCAKHTSAHATKSHCKNGHPLIDGNLYFWTDAKERYLRKCRACNNARSVQSMRRYYARKRATKREAVPA